MDKQNKLYVEVINKVDDQVQLTEKAYGGLAAILVGFFTIMGSLAMDNVARIRRRDQDIQAT